MSEIIIKLIGQMNISVFVLMLILIFAFWAAYQIGKMVNKFGGFEKERQETRDNLTSIKDNMAKINATVELLYKSHLSTVQTRSPLSLSDLGQKISNDLMLPVKVNDHWEEIKGEITKKNPSNPYDIQVIALDIAKHCFDNFFSIEEKNEIKLYAYNKGINLMEIYPIIGIISRDRILKEMNIPVEQVDDHSPKK
ncbi:MAG: hypothetical protein V1770_00120 [bacterium]